MKRSEYLLKENKEKEEKKPLKRSEYLLKSPIGMTSGILTSSPQTDARKVTAAPKVTTSSPTSALGQATFRAAPEKSWIEKTLDNIADNIKNSWIIQQPLRRTNMQSLESFVTETGWTPEDIANQATDKSANGDAFSVHPNYMKKAIKSTNSLNNSQKEVLLKKTENIKKSWEYSPIAATGANVKAGMFDVGGNLAATVQMLGGDKVPGVKSVLQAAVTAADKAQADAQSYAKRSGDQTAGEAVQQITQMVPYIILGYMTAGTSTAAGGLATASDEAVKTAITSVMKNPSFWYSFINGAGGKYRSALENGASRAQATMNALYAIPEAIVEIGGGFGADEMINNSMMRTAGAEVGEELTQNVIGKLGEKATYDPNKPIFSTEGDAVINPMEMAKTAAMTVLLSGVADVGQKGIGKVASAVDTQFQNRRAGAEIGKQFEAEGMTAEDMEAIVDEGLAANPESSSYKLAAKLQQKLDKGEPVSWTEYGKLYNENVRNVDAEAKVEATDGAGAEKVTPGFTKNEYSEKVSNKTIRALDAIGKKIGINISIGAPSGTGQGSFNGYYENGRIIISQDSDDPLKVVLSHEVTHRMKETAPEEYAKFLEIAVNATEQLGGKQKSEILEEYKTWYSDYSQTDFKYEDALDEITADFAGRLADDLSLFKKLVDADRNVAQRFIDGVREFISKVKSTFSKDKSKADTASIEKYGLKVSELEEAVKQWDAMVKETETVVKSGNAEIENTAGAETGGERKYLIKENSKGKYVQADRQVIFGNDPESWKNQIEIYLHKIIKKEGSVQIPTEDGDVLRLTKDTVEKSSFRNFIKKENRYLTDEEYLTKIEAEAHIDELAQISKRGPQNVPDEGGIHGELAQDGWNYRKAFFRDFDGKYYVVKISVGLGPNGKTVYNIGSIRERSFPTDSGSSSKNRGAHGDSVENEKTTGLKASSPNSIPDSSSKSNPQFSLKKNTDNQGRELSAEQAEYFKDSKVRDKDGNLLVMYRGGNEDFTVFDRKKSKYSNLYGRGFYFTDSESHAKQYGNVRAYYLDIKNPVSTTEKTITKEQLRSYLEAVAENEDDYSFENYGYGATVGSVLDSVYEGKSDFNMIYDISQTAIGDMVEAVELFNEVNGTDYDGLILDTETVTFKSNQAKSVDNKKPTENPDIRYSFKKPKAEDSTAEPEKSETDEEAFRRAFGDWAYDPEEVSYFDETGLADDAAQNPKEDYSNIDSLYADLAKRENIIAEESDEREQKLIDGAYQNAIADPATEKKKLPEKVTESGNFLKRKIVNSGAAIRDIAKVTKDKFLYPTYNRARGSMNIAEDMLTNKQTNIRGEKVGESLESIILPIKEKGKEYFREFHLYLLNKHNVARMSIENAEATARAKAELDKFLADNPQIARLAALGEDAIQNAAKWDDARGFRAKQYLELRNEWQKLLRTKNKPIFFDKEETPLSADISRTKAEEILKKHPEFAEYEAKVRKYLDNLMQYRVDSGLITQEEADYFRKKYPDYIPTYRNKESVLQELYGKKNIGKTLGIARGGVEKLLPLDIALAEMTKKVIKNGQKNMFANKLFDIFEKNGKLFEEYITDANEGIRELDKQIDEFGEDDPKFKNTVGFYKDGKYIELTMTPKLYEAFAEMSKAPEEKAPVADWWRQINNAYKKLITTYDPTFIIRNGLKDLQDATINSRDTKAMLRNLPKAYKEIATNGEMFELYRSMGGLHSSRFEEIKTKGVKKKSWVKKLPDALAFGNMMVEQAPRLAEFMSVLEKSDRNDPDVLADALYAAADVTTNFGESGTWGKLLNAYYVPFLNPAIQGIAKIGRLITEPKTAKQWYGLAAKAVIMGVGAGFLNDIIIGIFGDDEEKEEYEKLQDRVKDNYFLIPTDDGKFAKIPKGRIAASLGVVADRVRDVVKGEKVSAGEAVARILENIAPENPITNNILSPFITADLFNNESKGRTWYGSDIESDSLQGLPAGERFDSSTDYISKYVGKALGLSPKKINYILKQYTGGAGRTILPMITPSEQKGDTIAGKIGYGALSILTSNFMVDSKLSNKVSGEFYDAVSEAEQKKNSSKGTLADKVVYKHLNRERNQMSGYNQKIREAETDSSLTSKERDVAVRTATALRTEYQKEVLDNLDKYRANVEKYLKEYPGKDEEKKIDYAYRKANYATYGAKYAIRASGGKSVYDKALEKVNRGKTTWKEYYEEYFGKDERRYEKLREKYDISYAEYEEIAKAMSQNSTEEEEIEALHKLGYKRSTARGIRRNYNKVK